MVVMTPHDIRNRAWVAGYICAKGSFYVRRKQGRSPVIIFQLMVDSTQWVNLEQIARWTNLPVSVMSQSGSASRGATPKAVLRTEGATLHAMMTSIWRYLDDNRKLQYNRLCEDIGIEGISL